MRPGIAGAVRLDLTVDVTAAPGLEAVPGSSSVAASVFFPDQDPVGWTDVVVALPGGGYTRRYYDMEVPGLPGYSMAARLCRSGHVVVTVDHLGTGGSTLPKPDALTLRSIAAANHSAVIQIAELLRTGDLPTSPGDWEPPAIVGVGHSMGGSFLVIQQANHRTFDAVVTLGTPTVRVTFPLDPSGTELTGLAHGPLPPGVPEGYSYPGTRAPFRYAFYLGDVPPGVIDADKDTVTTVPPCAQELFTPGVLVPHAGAITVPVLAVFGERDVSANPHDDAAAFTGSSDVSLYVLEGSAHCHNLAATREVLWDRIDRWTAMVLDRS